MGVTLHKDKQLKNNTMKEEIEDWLARGGEYAEGVKLLAKYSRNKMLVRRYEHGTARFLGETLKGVLRRMAGVSMERKAAESCCMGKEAAENGCRDAGESGETGENGESGETGKTGEAAENGSREVEAGDRGELPEVVVEAKSLLHELWVEMGAKQVALKAVGDGNSDAEVAERKRIMAERDPIIKDYNELYELKEQYFETGEVPEGLERMVKRLRGEATEATATSLWAGLSDVELKDARHAKKTQLTRCENQLNYQSNRKEAERKPMPDGPKRKQIESKYKTVLAELRDMDEEIKRRGI